MKKDLSYSISDHDGIKLVKLSGNISSSTQKKFEALIEKLSQKNNVIINMKDIDVVTSAGLSSLIKISINARKEKWKVMFMGLNEGVKRMIDVLDVYQHFIIINSIEEGRYKASRT